MEAHPVLFNEVGNQLKNALDVVSFHMGDEIHRSIFNQHTCTGASTDITELYHSTRFSLQRTRFSHMTSNQAVENPRSQLDKSN